MATKRGYGSGSLREVRLGVWELRYAGRSKTVRAGRKEAERALATMVATAPGRRPVAVGVTLGQLLNEWLAAARLQDSTRATYTAALAHLPAAMRKTKLSALELRTFDQLYATLDRQGVSRHMIRKLHTALSAALTEGVRWQYLPHHPARGARLPELARRQVVIPPDEALDRLLAAAASDPQGEIWVRLALATGARRSELLALRWSAVDLKADTIRFAAALQKNRALKTTKTNRERTLTLDPGTLAVLSSWRSTQAQRALAVGVKIPKTGFVLSNALDATVPWRPDGASQRFRRLADRAGLPDLRLNYLRHANASWMLGDGVDPVTASQRLGHSRPTTTMDVYGHVLDGADQAAAATLGRRFG